MGDADVVVAVVVRLVVVGREVVVFFVLVGALELLGVAMPAPTKNDSRANGITAFHRRCPGSVTNHHTAGPRNADPTRKGQAARSMSPPRMRRPPKTIPIIARMVFMI